MIFLYFTLSDKGCYNLTGKTQKMYSTTYPTDIYTTNGTEMNNSKADKSKIWLEP